MKKTIVDDVERFLWLHGAVDPGDDPVDLLCQLYAAHVKLQKQADELRDELDGIEPAVEAPIVPLFAAAQL